MTLKEGKEIAKQAGCTLKHDVDYKVTFSNGCTLYEESVQDAINTMQAEITRIKAMLKTHCQYCDFTWPILELVRNEKTGIIFTLCADCAKDYKVSSANNPY
jgi:hypothetical protein